MEGEAAEAVTRLIQRVRSDPVLRVDMSILDELKSYMGYARERKAISTASYRTLDDMHELGRMFEHIQYMRGRVLEIKTGHLGGRRILHRMWKTGLAVMYAEYTKVSPARRRDAMVDARLDALQERIDEFDMIISTADDTEKLLSSSYYTVRELARINAAFVDAKHKDREHSI